MADIAKIDYSALDIPQVLMFLFHPRKEWAQVESTSRARDILIPVEKDVAIGARFHMTDKSSCNILFFHGNGEIVSDYDDLAPVYNSIHVNFLPVDYRGYGRSSGTPTVSTMMKDCRIIFEYVRKWLKQEGYKGPMIVMGRSLGSASALELAYGYPQFLDGLIIESGFAYATPLLELLGVNASSIGFREEEGFRNVDKIRSFDKPVLIIHAEFDHIIPFSDGRDLFEACPSRDKTLLKIPGANHNDIFARGLREYMAAVQVFTQRLKEK